MAYTFRLEGESGFRFTDIEELIETEIDNADTIVLRECKCLFNIKGTELAATTVGVKKVPKIQVELHLELYDLYDGEWETISKSKPMWIKTTQDIERKLKPALEELILTAGHADFLHVHMY